MVSPKDLDQSEGSSHIFTRVVPEFLRALCVKISCAYRIFFEEEAIMRAQQPELIYSEYDMLYKILLDAPR
jgi:hypothetical protein